MWMWMWMWRDVSDAIFWPGGGLCLEASFIRLTWREFCAERAHQRRRMSDVQHGCPGREDRVEGRQGHQRDCDHQHHLRQARRCAGLCVLLVATAEKDTAEDGS